LPIIAAARDYDGKLSALLDRSVAHAHPDTALQLFRAAEQTGCPPTLIIDGFTPLASERKVAVLRAYAGDRLLPDAEALAEPFQIPYEPSLAAACLEDPACLVSRTALFDAYSRRRCEGTSNAPVVRTALCARTTLPA
jgi:hypothetical protein